MEEMNIPPVSTATEPLNEEDFKCALTEEIMKDPVRTADGMLYERSAITQWFETCRANNRPITSPKTGKVLESAHLEPDLFVRGLIERFLENKSHIEKLAHAKSSFFDHVNVLNINEYFSWICQYEPQILICGTNLGAICFYDLNLNRMFRKESNAHVGKIVFFDVDPVKQVGVSVSNRGLIKFWNIQLQQFKYMNQCSLVSSEFTEVIAATCYNNSILILSTDDKKLKVLNLLNKQSVEFDVDSKYLFLKVITNKLFASRYDGAFDVYTIDSLENSLREGTPLKPESCKSLHWNIAASAGPVCEYSNDKLLLTETNLPSAYSNLLPKLVVRYVMYQTNVSGRERLIRCDDASTAHCEPIIFAEKIKNIGTIITASENCIKVWHMSPDTEKLTLHTTINVTKGKFSALFITSENMLIYSESGQSKLSTYNDFSMRKSEVLDGIY